MSAASLRSAFGRGILRTVRGSLKRFVALATITALGVTMLIGLGAACEDLRYSADEFFDAQSLFDIRVQSTLGLTDEDVEALAALDGVEAAEGGYVETAYTTVGSSSKKVDVKALSSSGMNEPLVMEGRLPESADEIAVTVRFLEDSGLSIGDTVTFRGADDDDEDAGDAEDDEDSDASSTQVFERGEYTIVGAVLDPMDINGGEGAMTFRSSGGSEYSFFVLPECVTAEAYTVVYLIVEGADAPLCYSDEYEAIVDEVMQTVEDASSEREAARGESLRAEATEEVDEAEADALEELAEAEQEIEDAQAELDEALAEVADGQAELDEQRAEALAQLEEAQAQIDEGLAELEAAQAQVDDARAELETQLAEVEAGLAEADAGISELEASLPAGEQGLTDAQSQLYATLYATRAELSAAYDQLVSAQETLGQSEREIAEGMAELEAAQAELDNQRAEALAELAEAQQELDDALAEIEDGQAELDEARETLESERADALAQIADARAEVGDISDATWYVQDRSNLSSYASVDSDASSIEAIGTVLPVVFFVVAVLISLTTMTRMVEEERGLIGVYKALGYSRGRILSKYALYALSACVIGAVVGDLLGFVTLPAVIFTIFSTMYALPGFVFLFDLVNSLVAFALFAAGIVGATLLTCWRALGESPAGLMRPKAPRAGSRILLEHVAPLWRRMRFLSKVTARNLFRYKRRFLMTVCGVAGCVALLITGFGIRDTVIALSDRQYGDEGITRYDLMVACSADDLDDVLADLEANSGVEDLTSIYLDSVTVSYGDDKESAQLVVVSDAADLEGYVALVDEGGEALGLGSEGVLITKNAEDVLGFSVGEQITVQGSTLAEGTATVEGIALNYLSNTVYMTVEAYEAAFGETCEMNAALVHLSGTSDEQIELSERLAQDSRLLSVSSTAEIVRDFSTAFTLINTVVYVVIVLAAALAFTVVFTLSNTNISEREREIATLKVLGFKRHEVRSYINKETLILTGLGVLLGLPLGYAIARSLTWILKMPSIYFDVVVDPLSYVISAALAFAFTLVVNRVTNRSIDRIDMVGALKSAE